MLARGNHVEEFSEGADTKPLRSASTPWRLLFQGVQFISGNTKKGG